MCDHDTHDADTLFDAFNDIQPKPGAASQVIERTRQAILERSVRPDGVVESWWSIRTNRGVFAAVAVLVIIAASLALPTLFSPSVATGFAQVREQLDRVLTITFDVRLEALGGPTATLHQMVRQDGRSREQYSDGRYVVSEQTEDAWTRLEVNPTKNSARITYGIPQVLPFDVLRLIRDLPNSADASPIESRTINGRSCPGFLIVLEVDETSQQMRLWIDPETHLPIHGVVTATVERKRSGGAATKGLGDSSRSAATLNNFKYDIELEDSLFALVPPEGYTVTTVGSPPERRSVPWPAKKLLLSVGKGIGPVEFGMSREQVVERFGQPEERTEPTQQTQRNGVVCERETWCYNSQGLSILFESPPGGVFLVECKQESPTNLAYRGMTREGIGLEATPQDVRRAYPDILEEQPITNDGFGLYIYPDLRLMVGFVDGVVHKLSIRHAANKPPASEQEQ